MAEYNPPMHGWLIVRVDGDRVTKVEVESDETVELDMEPMEEAD